MKRYFVSYTDRECVRLSEIEDFEQNIASQTMRTSMKRYFASYTVRACVRLSETKTKTKECNDLIIEDVSLFVFTN
jgi:hypothetical protein